MTRAPATRANKSRRAVSALLLVTMALAALLPLQVSALVGWSLTADPRSLKVDEETDVVMRLTDTGDLGDIACLSVDIPRDVQYRGGRIVATSVDGEWEIEAHNNDPTQVVVFNRKGDAKLQQGDWVKFSVTVRPREAGLSIWTAEVSQSENCENDVFLPQILLQFVLLDDKPDPTATPTSTPTAKPTLAPTPTPTDKPTPTPTLAPTPTPTQKPTPTPTPTPASTPTPPPPPTPTQPPTPTLRPTPTPTIPAGTTPSPTPVRPPDATRPPDPSQPSSTPSPTPDSNVSVVPLPPAPPPDGPGIEGAAPDPPAPIFRYEMPPSLYSVFEADAPAFQPSFDTTVALGAPASWFIPALVTGVPGLLIILLVAANVLIGASWLPTFGRLLGPEPDAPDDDARVWWAAGRPIQ